MEPLNREHYCQYKQPIPSNRRPNRDSSAHPNPKQSPCRLQQLSKKWQHLKQLNCTMINARGAICTQYICKNTTAYNSKEQLLVNIYRNAATLFDFYK